MKKAQAKGSSQPAQLIREFLRGGLTVTVGGVPILITVGEGAAPAVRPARAGSDRLARTRDRLAQTRAVAPKPRRKSRRRKSKRLLAPDPRDIRGHLATQMEGATLTALAQHFHVKRPLMKRMLKRMQDRKEITLFKGAFFNNKRLRQRRVASKYSETSTAAPELPKVMDAAEPDSRPELAELEPAAPVAQHEPVASVPDPEPEEEPEATDYPHRNAA